MEKVVGILGGMGPDATVDLMQRIIRLTPALDDIDHIRCIVDNNPKVPSRIKAIIEGDGENPGPCMADMGKRLEAWGADFLVIACNTAHYYFKDVQQAVTIPVINLIDLVSSYFRNQYPAQNNVGLLASPAVTMTGLYTNKLRTLGVKDIWPDPEYQKMLLDVIKDVKKGDAGVSVCSSYVEVCNNLKKKGAKTAIIACTELSALQIELPIEAVDAAHVLAEEIVRIARGSLYPMPI
jgi:aspartate racemase